MSLHLPAQSPSDPFLFSSAEAWRLKSPADIQWHRTECQAEKVIFLSGGKEITLNQPKTNIHLSDTFPGGISEKKKRSETETTLQWLGET